MRIAPPCLLILIIIQVFGYTVYRRPLEPLMELVSLRPTNSKLAISSPRPPITDILYIPSTLSLSLSNKPKYCLDDDHFCSILCDMGFRVHFVCVDGYISSAGQVKCIGQCVRAIPDIVTAIEKNDSRLPVSIALVANEVAVTSVLNYLSSVVTQHQPYATSVGAFVYADSSIRRSTYALPTEIAAVALLDPIPVQSLFSETGRRQLLRRYAQPLLQFLDTGDDILHCDNSRSLQNLYCQEIESIGNVASFLLHIFRGTEDVTAIGEGGQKKTSSSSFNSSANGVNPDDGGLPALIETNTVNNVDDVDAILAQELEEFEKAMSPQQQQQHSKQPPLLHRKRHKRKRRRSSLSTGANSVYGINTGRNDCDDGNNSSRNKSKSNKQLRRSKAAAAAATAAAASSTAASSTTSSSIRGSTSTDSSMVISSTTEVLGTTPTKAHIVGRALHLTTTSSRQGFGNNFGEGGTKSPNLQFNDRELNIAAAISSCSSSSSSSRLAVISSSFSEVPVSMVKSENAANRVARAPRRNPSIDCTTSIGSIESTNSIDGRNVEGQDYAAGGGSDTTATVDMPASILMRKIVHPFDESQNQYSYSQSPSQHEQQQQRQQQDVPSGQSKGGVDNTVDSSSSHDDNIGIFNILEEEQQLDQSDSWGHPSNLNELHKLYNPHIDIAGSTDASCFVAKTATSAAGPKYLFSSDECLAICSSISEPSSMNPTDANTTCNSNSSNTILEQEEVEDLVWSKFERLRHQRLAHELYVWIEQLHC